MEFTFKRSLVNDTYFNDLGISVSNGDKFDFYEEGELTGTLIDSLSQAIGTFRNGAAYFTKKNSFWENRYNFQLEESSGAVFAKGDVAGGRKNSTVIFPAYGSRYHLTMSTNHHTESDYSSKAEFQIDNDVYCIINYFPFVASHNWWKRNFSSSPFEGVIILADGLSREHLFGFVLLLNRQIERNRD